MGKGTAREWELGEGEGFDELFGAGTDAVEGFDELLDAVDESALFEAELLGEGAAPRLTGAADLAASTREDTPPSRSNRTLPVSASSNFPLQFPMDDNIRSITLTLRKNGTSKDVGGLHKDGSPSTNMGGKVDAKVEIAVTKDGQTLDYLGEDWKGVWIDKAPKGSGLKDRTWLFTSQVSAAKYGVGTVVFQFRRADSRSTEAWAVTVPVSPGDWGPSYLVNGKLARLRSGKSYEDWWTSIPATVATSTATKSQAMPLGIERAKLLEIYPGVKADLEAYLAKQAAKTLGPDDLDIEQVVTQMVKNLNDAFRIMAIDTLSAVSSYLANAFIESDQFRFMTESALKNGGNRPYEPDPSKVKLDENYLNQARTGAIKLPTGKTLSVTGYQKGGEVNPLDNGWQNSFIGRGPIQVTNRSGYLQTIAVIEHRLTELKNDADKKLVTAALVAIKAAPLQAANPVYGYLFSAAFMKTFKGDLAGRNFSWMGSQPKGQEKLAAYDRIMRALNKP